MKNIVQPVLASGRWLLQGNTASLSRIAIKALIAATLACLMTGCIAGMFFNESSVLFQG